MLSGLEGDDLDPARFGFFGLRASLNSRVPLDDEGPVSFFVFLLDNDVFVPTPLVGEAKDHTVTEVTDDGVFHFVPDHCLSNPEWSLASEWGHSLIHVADVESLGGGPVGSLLVLFHYDAGSVDFPHPVDSDVAIDVVV
jgi:hypothetical protein